MFSLPLNTPLCLSKVETFRSLNYRTMANGFKSGGRQVGSPNKRKAIGKRIEEFLEYEWDNIHSYMEEMTHKEKAEFIVKLLPYATPKYSHKKYDQDIMDTPLFRQVQILDTVDEKERMDRVRAYEEKHGVEIL